MLGRPIEDMQRAVLLREGVLTIKLDDATISTQIDLRRLLRISVKPSQPCLRLLNRLPHAFPG